jgi:hypothetical protein
VWQHLFSEDLSFALSTETERIGFFSSAARSSIGTLQVAVFSVFCLRTRRGNFFPVLYPQIY